MANGNTPMLSKSMPGITAPSKSWADEDSTSTDGKFVVPTPSPPPSISIADAKLVLSKIVDPDIQKAYISNLLAAQKFLESASGAPESKWCYYSQSNRSLYGTNTNANAFTAINLIPQGTDQVSRIGYKVRLRAITLGLYYFANNNTPVSVTGLNANPAYDDVPAIRISIVQDKFPLAGTSPIPITTAGAPSPADPNTIWWSEGQAVTGSQTNGMISCKMRNPNTKDRFEVYHDHIITNFTKPTLSVSAPAAATPPATTNYLQHWGNGHYYYHHRFEGHGIECNYYSPAATHIMNNLFWLGLWSNRDLGAASGAIPTVTFQVQMWFTDET